MVTQLGTLNNAVIRKITAISLFLLLDFSFAFSQVFSDTSVVNNLWLEMGNSDSLTTRNIPFKNAIIFSQGPDQTYWIVICEYARHDLDNNLLILRNGRMACYDFMSKNTIPTDTSSFSEIIVDIKKNSLRISSKE